MNSFRTGGGLAFLSHGIIFFSMDFEGAMKKPDDDLKKAIRAEKIFAIVSLATGIALLIVAVIVVAAGGGW